MKISFILLLLYLPVLAQTTVVDTVVCNSIKTTTNKEELNMNHSFILEGIDCDYNVKIKYLGNKTYMNITREAKTRKAKDELRNKPSYSSKSITKQTTSSIDWGFVDSIKARIGCCLF